MATGNYFWNGGSDDEGFELSESDDELEQFGEYDALQSFVHPISKEQFLAELWQKCAYAVFTGEPDRIDRLEVSWIRCAAR